MIKILRSKSLIVLICLVIVLISYLLLSKNSVVGSISETEITLTANQKREHNSDFEEQRKDYAFVSFDNLYENTSLYFGSKIYQVGHIKKLDSEHKYMLVALDGNDVSKMCKIKYNLASFAQNISNLKEDDAIKFYGKVLSVDNYVNEKGREMSRPVISANFIQMKLHK
ncbi:hypothetical protein EGT49_00695 [Companilactobacillus suantsaicola]|uniref:tRNA_anti-like n=1 Tax=Companilactobacillus suantsaicola TaxID=2487723 RepID=A0A4Z0JQW0_9LACO|nr:hypothetical protein [Companilactobacillus suantsaicola]TGD25429.1 hypothetical protein EGT49_00695 [Companilactobacillus suantsaicola]